MKTTVDIRACEMLVDIRGLRDADPADAEMCRSPRGAGLFAGMVDKTGDAART
jgi:hypothetical protein